MTRLVMFDYDPSWPKLYEDEAKALMDMWREVALSIHHIGSTSVPRLRAKPIIDIMIVIKTGTVITDYDMPMSELGYRCRGECLDRGGTPGRYYYSKDTDGLRTHQVHVLHVGHYDIDNKINFRDYLRSHPDKAAEYGLLKSNLVEVNTDGIMEYIQAKEPFIHNCLKLAKEWRNAEQGGQPDAFGAGYL